MKRISLGKPAAGAILILAAALPPAFAATDAVDGAPRGHAGTACRSFTQPQMAQIGAAMQAVLESERKSLQMPSLGVALFDCAGTVWAGAAGYSDKSRRVPAGADTVFRAGSVTDVLTVLAMLRLADRGVLDLDVPVQRYLPDFAPQNRFPAEITLRLLAAHRAGLVDQPAAGSYFAASSPDLASAVRSLNDTRVLAAPGTVTAYSRAGIAVIGRVLEAVTGKSYAALMRDELFVPARMASSAVWPADSIRPLAYAEMTSYDAPRTAAPAIDPGLQPDLGSTTTLRDLASLGTALLAGGRAPGGEPIVSARALGQMEGAKPAPDRGGGRTLGFIRSDLQGHALDGAAGAVYGFTSNFDLLPADGIGAVAYDTLDFGSSARRVAEYALRTALAVRDGKALPGSPTSRPLTTDEAVPLAGEYRHAGSTVMIRWVDGEAFIETPRLAGRLRRGASGYVMDDYTVPLRLEIEPHGRWVEADGTRYARAAARKPVPPAAEIAGLIGDYGWDHASIRAFERDGSLFVRIDGFAYDPMTRVAADTWQLPASGPFYPGERLEFSRDAHGLGTGVTWHGLAFPRRNIIIDPPAGKLSEAGLALLRQRALAGSPPVETEPHRAADLVAIRTIDPSVKLDVRYATSRNLLGFPVYSKSAAYLQRPAAEALARADKKLHAQGFGIVVFDAYRPWFVTKMFWDGTPDAAHDFVADPSAGSRHNRGEAVDISLVDLATGDEVTMTGGYDEFSPRSYPRYDGGTSEQRWRRDVLRTALESERFSVYQFEWWHFDYADWKSYGLLNTEFSKLPP